MKLEICSNRIELCQELSVGGITPAHDIIERVSRELRIPFFVLIRPRGGDFNYNTVELKQIISDIEFCKQFGASGIVSGILTEAGTVDAERTKILLETAKPLPFTFHRAIDVCKNPFEAITILAEMGVERILTSGGASSAEEGLDTLTTLKKLSKNRPIIMPGAGITSSNIEIFKKAGFSEVHSSATKGIVSGSYNKSKEAVSSVEEIRRMKNLV